MESRGVTYDSSDEGEGMHGEGRTGQIGMPGFGKATVYDSSDEFTGKEGQDKFKLVCQNSGLGRQR
jgi:hypothetical protein